MIPNFFSKKPIPEKLPAEMEKIVADLKNSSSQEECLRRAYDILTQRYRGYKVLTYIYLWRIFETDLEKIWARNGFLHCHVMNYLLRVLLVKSGWFEDSDIELKHSMYCYVSPHQYLRVRVGKDKWINVDLWYYHYGKQLGEYAHGFH